MTQRERTAIGEAMDRARRAWLEAQGGYRKVEDDAQGQDLVLRRLSGEDGPPHGSRARYGKGCRCPRCAEANRRYARDWSRSHDRSVV